MGRPRYIGVAGAALVLIACMSLLLLLQSSDRGKDVRITDIEREWLAAHGELRIALDPDFPPLEFFNAEGLYAGLIADYFRVMERNLGVRFRYVRCKTSDDVLLAAQKGEIDANSAAQVTPERSPYLTYTTPLLDIPNVIIARAERTGTMRTHQLEQELAERRRTESALRDSEQIFRSVTSTMLDVLLVSELVSNAFKHAFPEGRPGKLTVTIEKPGATVFRITVEDDGVGFSPQPAGNAVMTTSMGMSLVYTLADQLSATIEHTSDPGTQFVITFESPKSKRSNHS